MYWLQSSVSQYGSWRWSTLYISCARGSVKRAGEKCSVAGCQTRNCCRTTGDGPRLHSWCGKSQYAVMWNAILQRITRYSHKANHVYTGYRNNKKKDNSIMINVYTSSHMCHKILLTHWFTVIVVTSKKIYGSKDSKKRCNKQALFIPTRFDF